MNDRKKCGEALRDVGFWNNAGVVEDEDRKIDTGVVDDTFGDEKSKHADAEDSVTFLAALTNDSSVALSCKVDNGIPCEGVDLQDNA